MNFWVLIQMYKQVILLTLTIKMSGVYTILLVGELYTIILVWVRERDIKTILRYWRLVGKDCQVLQVQILRIGWDLKSWDILKVFQDMRTERLLEPENLDLISLLLMLLWRSLWCLMLELRNLLVYLVQLKLNLVLVLYFKQLKQVLKMLETLWTRLQMS